MLMKLKFRNLAVFYIEEIPWYCWFSASTDHLKINQIMRRVQFESEANANLFSFCKSKNNLQLFNKNHKYKIQFNITQYKGIHSDLLHYKTLCIIPGIIPCPLFSNLNFEKLNVEALFFFFSSFLMLYGQNWVFES